MKPVNRKRSTAQDRTAQPRNPRSSLAHRLRTVAAVVATVSLGACASWPAQNDTPDTEELLRNSLPVAAAALGAGQLDVARRLYLSLEERFDSVPEPVLGLGYVAFQSGDFTDAERYFLQAAERASDVPAMQAEALLGAGRTALVQNRPRAARRHFRNAEASGQDTPSSAWIANGLAVVATLRGDHERAETYYAQALRRSTGHPRIAANHVRMLIAAGRIDDATRAYTEHPPTYWADDDGPALSLLVEESRRDRFRQALADPPAGGRDTVPEDSEAQSGTMSRQSGRDTPQLASPDPVRPSTETESRDLAPSPRPLDPNMAMRLHVPSPAPAQPNADSPPSGGTTPADSSGLIFRLDRWSEPQEPMPAVNGTVPAPVAGTPRSGVPVPASGLAESAATAAHPPAGPVAASATVRSHPVSEPEAPVGATLDPTSAPTLALILGQSRRLHLDHDASSVLAASPEVADVQLLAPNLVYVIGKGVGRTSVVVLDDNERVEEWVVSVALDLEPLRAVLAGEPDFGAVRAQRLTRGVALIGEVASAAAADRALRLAAGMLPEGVPIENELRIAAPQQVNLEVQIAEVQRSVTEELGINWGLDTRFGFRIGRVLSDGFLPVLFNGSLASSINLTSKGSGRFRAMIDALATAGLANVLARPNVTAVSGESASFFSGGEFPLPTGFDDGVLIFEYKKYGVLLDFVPTVVDTGRIVLTVRPEVSEPSLNESVTVIVGVDVPVINVRRAETTVEVADGESIVIAGLFRNRSNTVESGVPVVKDVPLLGALFGHTSARSDELELIVVVTARLVQPYEGSGDTDAPPATLRADGYHY